MFRFQAPRRTTITKALRLACLTPAEQEIMHKKTQGMSAAPHKQTSHSKMPAKLIYVCNREVRQSMFFQFHGRTMLLIQSGWKK